MTVNLNSKTFWNYVDKHGPNGCWNWIGYRPTRRSGLVIYGELIFNGEKSASHRVAYELLVGPIPKGMQVLHHCDNYACVNPAHLFLGTPLENAQDRNRKGRQARGSKMNTAKLTEAQVKLIREGYANGESRQSIATRFGISPENVWFITKRRTWKHI